MKYRVKHSLTLALCCSALALWSGGVVAQAPPGPAPGGQQAVRTVQEIKFTGNQRFTAAQLSTDLPLKVGDVNTREAVKAALTKIVERYRAAGSDLALMVDISLPDQSHTIVNFVIDENGTGGDKGAAPRPGGRAGGPPPPPPAGGGG